MLKVRNAVIDRIARDMLNTIESGETGVVDGMIFDGYPGLRHMNNAQLVEMYEDAELQEDEGSNRAPLNEADMAYYFMKGVVEHETTSIALVELAPNQSDLDPDDLETVNDLYWVIFPKTVTDNEGNEVDMTSDALLVIEAILDMFHDNVPISVPDDFSIRIYTQHGLQNSESRRSYIFTCESTVIPIE